jgi:hypothetical protein
MLLMLLLMSVVDVVDAAADVSIRLPSETY